MGHRERLASTGTTLWPAWITTHRLGDKKDGARRGSGEDGEDGVDDDSSTWGQERWSTARVWRGRRGRRGRRVSRFIDLGTRKIENGEGLARTVRTSWRTS